MNLEEFRENFINEDICAESVNNHRYEEEVFIDIATDILKNDYSLITDMSQCFYEFTKGTKAYKSMRIDAAYLDLVSNTVNLLYVDFNKDEMKNITNEFIYNKSQLLLNYFENSLKGYFTQAEQSDPAVQLAKDIKLNIEYIYKIHLFIASTNKLSKVVKTLELPDFVYNNKIFKVDLDVLDIEKIYNSKLANFQKDDIIINCSDFGITGIPCIKADIETDQYESYLAIVPGSFLADIYKKHNASLLEANVRSFLKFNGAVNKGIRGTILNEKSRFFTYNNGISTTAKSINTIKNDIGLLITSFTDLQIINGGQTTATLAATNIKNNADLSGIFVQMKLTILKDTDPELIRNIARYANSQNKVKTADLNSSHPFYVRIEDFSRKVYAPLASGNIVQEKWFFERARGQYEQPMMQMTKSQQNDYKLVNPKKKKFTLPDLAKYINCSEMLPHFVSWGGEVNSAKFHSNMEKMWTKDNSFCNELFYKELIGKKILFSFIENIISDQPWYQERRAYRPQIVAYTFAKLVYEAREMKKDINYIEIWNHQSVSDVFKSEISRIGKLVFDTIYDENRSTANIETYCKKEECWQIISKKTYDLSEAIVEMLITPSEQKIEKVIAKKEQRFTNGISDEISVYEKGSKYWTSIIERGKSQGVLNYNEEKQLLAAVNYCNGKYLQLSSSQIKEIVKIMDKLKEYMIE